MQGNLSTVNTMREDIPLSVSSIELAKRAQQAERALATQETGIQFDGDRPFLPKPATVLPFLAREADALFVAPSAMARVDLMQLEESQRSHDIALLLAPLAYGQDLDSLTAKQKATCRFAAVYALRSQAECWTDAAHHAAVDAAKAWMKTEGGATFSHLTDEHRHRLAVPLVSAVVCAFFGLLEGSKHLTPGQYIRITDAGK